MTDVLIRPGGSPVPEPTLVQADQVTISGDGSHGRPLRTIGGGGGPPLSDANPTTISDSTDVPGSSLAASRGDHQHAHGARGGGAQHSLFTSSSAGFAQLDIADLPPTRDLDVVFQPSATRPVLGIYSVDVVCSLTGGVGAAGEIQLLSDASNPPTTVRCSMFLQTGGGIGEDETVTNVVEGVLVYLVPEGHFVLISSIPVAGGPTFGSDFATEIRL